MKRSQIILIVLIALAIGAILSTFGSAGTYVNFEQADANTGKSYTVVGYLDKEGKMEYRARENSFTFYALDKDGNRKKVLLGQPKPQDFERSEEITMKGYSQDSIFIADEVLMKCPSKYNEEGQFLEEDRENVY